MRKRFRNILLSACVLALGICPAFLTEAEEESAVELAVTDPFEEQNAVDEALLQEAENGYPFEDPLVVLDPYGKSPLSAVVIFSTDEPLGGTITVKGKSPENDISGTFEAETNHIVPVYGLYNADTTEVELALADGTKNTLEITCEGTDLSAWEEIDAQMIDESAYDYSCLTILCTSGGKTLGIDAAGDIRWYFDYGGSMGVHQLANGHLMGPASYILRNYYHTTGLIEFDFSGKIYREYTIPGGMHHDFQELPDGNLLVAGSSPDLESFEDYVVEIDRETGEVVWELDTRNLFRDLTDGESASMLTDGSAQADWFHNNAIWYDAEHDWVLLSARHKDAVIAVNKSDKTLAWVLGDPDGWEYVDESLFFTPVGEDFEWFYGQHQVSELDNGDILLFDNGSGKVKLYNNENRVTGDEVYSRAVVYRIDTDAMTVEQVWQYGKERGPEWYSDWMSGAISLDGTMDALQITSGTNLYLPDEDSYDYGVSSQFTPGIVSTTRVDYVMDESLAFELTITGSTYNCQSFRSLCLPFYAKGATLDVTQSPELLGSLGETSTVEPEAEFYPEDARELPDGWTFTLDSTKLTLRGTFLTEEPADEVPEGYLVLRSGETTRFYALSQICTQTEDGTSVTASGWVSTDGLKTQSWEIYLIIDGVTYQSPYSLPRLRQPLTFEEWEAEQAAYGYYGKVADVETDLDAVTYIYDEDSAADAIETNIPTEESLVATSLAIDEQVEEELHSGNYDFENPLVIQDPYRISPLTALVLFETKEEVSVRVTVKGKTEAADISGEVTEPETAHRIPVIGLYADTDNRVLLELLDTDGAVVQSQELTVTTEKLPEFFNDIIEPVTTSGESAYGLTAVYGQNTKMPFAYDCNGDIRWCFTMKTGNYGLYSLSDGRMIVQDNESHVLSQQRPMTTAFYEMDYLGRAYTLYYLAKGGHHEIIEKEPGGNLLVLTSTLTSHYENAVMEVDRKTGEVIQEFGLEEIFGRTFVNTIDWAHVNTISYQPEDDTVIISCRNLESVIKLDWTTHEIKWILCDPRFWEGTAFEQYVLEPEGEFVYHFQQHSAYQLDADLDGNPDTVELCLFDNHCLTSRKVDYFEGVSDSYLTVYSIDEAAGTVSQLRQIPVIFSSITSNAAYDEKSGHIFGMCGHVYHPEDDRFGMTYEFDFDSGELLNQFSISTTYYRAREMVINYDDLASKMEPEENYIRGTLLSPIETEEEVPVPEETLEEGVSFHFRGPVLYEAAADHSVSQTIFRGQEHTYVYDLTEIRQHHDAYADYQTSLSIPIGDMAADTYEIYVVYEDGYYQTGEYFTIWTAGAVQPLNNKRPCK